MARLLLDSDILIYFLKGNRQVVEHVAKHDPEDLAREYDNANSYKRLLS